MPAQQTEGLIAEGVSDSKTVDVMFIDLPKWLHIEVEPDELTIADIDDDGVAVDMAEAEAEVAIQCRQPLVLLRYLTRGLGLRPVSTGRSRV